MKERAGEPGFFVRRFPFLSDIGDVLDRNVRNYGLQRGSLETLNSWGVNLMVENLTQTTNKIFEENPAILVANHPTLTEPLVLPATLPEREDVFMVMSQSFFSLAPQLERHTVPIFLGSKRENESAIAGVLRKALTYGDINFEDAHSRNIESINEASNRVSEGELGIIFPAPLRKLKEGQWKPGLGYLIDGIENPSEAYVIEAFIEGTSWNDAFRAIPQLRSKFPYIKVTFRDPQKISEVKDSSPHANERELIESMEKDYLEWVKSLKK